jgi:hypothetical protein
MSSILKKWQMLAVVLTFLNFKSLLSVGSLWLMSVILTIRASKIRTLEVEASPNQKSQTLSQKYTSQ